MNIKKTGNISAALCRFLRAFMRINVFDVYMNSVSMEKNDPHTPLKNKKAEAQKTCVLKLTKSKKNVRR